jgi:hypothetical protein
MLDAAEGEPIARMAIHSHVKDRAGAETLEGLSCPRPSQLAVVCGRGQAKVDRYSEALADRAIRRTAARRVRGDRAKSWSRPSLENPGRAKPKGGTSGQRAKHLLDRQGLSGGSRPRNRGLSGRPGATVAGALPGATVGGSLRVVTPRILSERGNLRRVNPRSAAGAKQNRHGTEGSKPPRG